MRRGPISHPSTDLGNASRFVDRNAEAVRYVPSWKSWLVWDGTRWARDSRARAQALAVKTVQAIADEAREAAASGRDDLAAALRAHAKASQSAARIKAMLTLAESQLVVEPAELDSSGVLLNCASGTIDLSTGELRPHCQSDLITKLTGTSLGEPGECPLWRSFLLDVTAGDADLVRYLQLAAGYSATGLRRKRAIVVLLGPGGTGKSTILETLRSALGGYAATTPMSTLLGASRTGGIPNDVAALSGRRLVIASEADDSGVWDAAKLKVLTGNDTLSARHLYGDFFEFAPTHHLWIATNRLPTAQRADEALFDRLHIVPIPAALGPRDLGLADALARELPGILRWIVDGAVAWGREGLRPTRAMTVARDRYRDAMDPVGAWLRTRVQIDPTGSIAVGDALRDYRSWATEMGELPVGDRAFGDRLLDVAGIERRRTTGGERRWYGIRLS